MRDAAGQLADRLHLLRLAQRLLGDLAATHLGLQPREHLVLLAPPPDHQQTQQQQAQRGGNAEHHVLPTVASHSRTTDPQRRPIATITG